VRSLGLAGSSNSLNATEVLKEGLLTKEAEYMKTWRSRYFVLYKNGRFLGFEPKLLNRTSKASHANKDSQQRNRFSVVKCQVIKKDMPKPFVFVVRLLDDKNRIIERSFCAASDREREEWCEAFQLVKSIHERKDLDDNDLANYVNINLIMHKTTKKKEDFKRIKQLGKGAFGNVFLVESEQKFYAMKVIPKSRLIDSKEKEHLRQERAILEKSNFPFLISLEYAFQTPNHLYMVMEYAAGGELYFHLKNEGRFAEEKARFYVEEIVVAIGHLHSINIIYRDLKLENILLDKQGHIKLVDFGLSKSLLEHEKTSTLCGTPEYLAPEVIDNEYYLSGYGKEVDWWSLGVIFYEMICARPPFGSVTEEDGTARLYHRILYCEPDFLFAPRRTTHMVKDLIKSLLIKQPNERMGHQGVEEIQGTITYESK
jgi:RAC serine/threonine-protein kinase